MSSQTTSWPPTQKTPICLLKPSILPAVDDIYTVDEPAEFGKLSIAKRLSLSDPSVVV